MMKILTPLILVAALAAAAYVGSSRFGLTNLFGIYLPYTAFVVFTLGFVWRILDWAKSPVPFRIPTTAGQQKSLPWIKNNELEAPSSWVGVAGRMFLEIFFFRSLWRNSRAFMAPGPRLTYISDQVLWLFGMIFHWSFALVFLRHYRFFVDPVPGFVTLIEGVDGFFEIVWHNQVHNITLPGLYVTDLLLLAGVTGLFLKRVLEGRMRLLSLPQDYFPLYLILAIALTGINMRYLNKVDVVAVKNLMQSLISLRPDPSLVVAPIFYVHLFLVSALALYFPFSKLMHAGGIWMSPTRNLANNSRAKRHLNPWNPVIKIRTYKEYEADFKDKMASVDLPLETETEKD